MAIRKPRLLLVDDDVNFRTELGKNLEQLGCSVEGAGSGPEALTVLDEKPFDVVILDLWMPGLTGVETLAEIRKKPLGVEVIMLTGEADVPSAIEGMRLGAFDFLIKSNDVQEVLDKVEAAFQHKLKYEERLRKAEARSQLDRLEKKIRF